MRDKYKKIIESYPNRGQALPDKFEIVENDLKEIIKEFNCHYPEVFIQFQLEFCRKVPMGDFSWDGFGWANNTLSPYMSLREVVSDARMVGVPKYLAPFRIDNGDFYCFDTRDDMNTVVIWDHNSHALETHKDFIWKDFTSWLLDTMDE